MTQGDLLYFIPELVATIIITAVAIQVFGFSRELGILFKKGFTYVGYGMTVLAIGSLFLTLSDISNLLFFVKEYQIELVHESAIILASVLIFMGIRDLRMEIMQRARDPKDYYD